MRNRAAGVAIGLTVIAVFHLSSTDARTQSGSCLVSTTNGSIQGSDRGASCAFLGVPYATPPLGALRWRPPQPVAPWASTLSATADPPACSLVSLNPPVGAIVGSEDCLKLNIWTPDPAPSGSAAVIVWLHTGGFIAASANFAGSRGQNLAERTGAIVVAPNYRLGPFGFLAHRALTAEDPAYPSSGNLGLLDQRAALAWVRDHISAFGGDPDNVTVAGTSAGGLSASLHLVSPGSAGLFDRAIVQSGPASFRWKTLVEAEAQGDAFAARLGCTDGSQVLSCMRAKSQADVLRALPIGLDQIVESARVQWGPVVDGVELPDQPRALYESGAFTRVPLIIGTNRDEGWPFVDRSFPGGVSAEQYDAVLTSEFGSDEPAVRSMYPVPPAATPELALLARKETLAAIVGDLEYVCETRRMARAVERTGTPVFVYSFEYEAPAVAGTRVIHGLETNFVFGNNFGPPSNHVLNDADRALFHSLSGYWTRFAANGHPNTDDLGVVHWPGFKHPTGGGRGSDKHLVFDTTIREGLRQREAFCDFWEPYHLRSVTGAVPASLP
jgi:para-nitrobenzyl esterase